jgi:hypothetical protein
MDLGSQTFLDHVLAHGRDDIYILQSTPRLAVSAEKASVQSFCHLF